MFDEPRKGFPNALHSDVMVAGQARLRGAAEQVKRHSIIHEAYSYTARAPTLSCRQCSSIQNACATQHSSSFTQ